MTNREEIIGNQPVLIVDDDPKSLLILSTMLSNAGYETTCAESAADALRVLETISPDLILLDVMLPDMNGFELCRRLKKSKARKDIPVIFLTSKVESESIVTGFRSGSVDYVTKPFNVTELLARVQVHLELRRSKQELKKRAKEIEEKNRKLEEQAEQLKDNAEKLKEMDRIKSRFFANISHEFRTPLTLIMGPLEQMLTAPQKDKKELKKTINMMLRNSRSLLTLVDQLLGLARLEHGEMKLQVARRNVVSFLNTITMLFESLALQNKVDLVFKKETDEIPLYFDPEKLEKIITNLLSNAFNYTSAKGKITVSVCTHTEIPTYLSGCVEISVHNTGAGIPGEQLPSIFDRFFRGQGDCHFNRKGAGIGLVLSKELIALHHGDINVHSREGENSWVEFVIRLPLGKEHLDPGEIVDPPKIKAACDSSRESHSRYMGDRKENEVETSWKENGDNKEAAGRDAEPGKGKKDVILLVEDNADLREYICALLDSHYEVEETVNGRDGINKAKEINPDIIISDVMMPEVDGFELCRVLKQDINTSHIPILMLTAKASEENVLKGLENLADDYITKPFNSRILTARIRNLVDLRRQLQQKMQQDMMLRPGDVSVSSIDREFIKELKEIIEKNISDPEFSVEQMATELLMSRSTLYKKVGALTGQSPQHFIRTFRLTRGAELLKAKAGNITEVAFKVGFSSTAYFTKCFKEKYSRRPSEFQVVKDGELIA